jgi:hypothetical protein
MPKWTLDSEMTTSQSTELEPGPPSTSRDRARRRFLAALGLFLAWVAFLLILGMLSATRPGRVAPSIEVEQSD